MQLAPMELIPIGHVKSASIGLFLASRECSDPTHDLIPSFPRQIVTHPLNQHQFCAFDIFVGIDASCDGDQRIVGAVNDECREL